MVEQSERSLTEEGGSRVKTSMICRFESCRSESEFCSGSNSKTPLLSRGMNRYSALHGALTDCSSMVEQRWRKKMSCSDPIVQAADVGSNPTDPMPWYLPTINQRGFRSVPRAFLLYVRVVP